MSGQATGESVEQVIEELRCKVAAVEDRAGWRVTKVYQSADGWCRVTIHVGSWAFSPRFKVWDDAVLVRLAAIDMLAT